MINQSPNYLAIIGQLAKEYEQKFNDLEGLVSASPTEEVLPQLTALAERTTDRFRAAQMALISSPTLLEAKEGDIALPAATALCSSFDEMRILFEMLLQIMAERESRV